MGVSPGTITKKLANPDKIDLDWLERFREALDLEEINDLFRDPSAPTPAELLRGMSEEQKREVLNFADFVRKRTGTND